MSISHTDKMEILPQLIDLSFLLLLGFGVGFFASFIYPASFRCAAAENYFCLLGGEENLFFHPWNFK